MIQHRALLGQEQDIARQMTTPGISVQCRAARVRRRRQQRSNLLPMQLVITRLAQTIAHRVLLGQEQDIA